MQVLIEILNEVRPAQDYSGATDFFSQGMLDSVDLTTLVAALEARFDVFLDVDEIAPQNFRNLGVLKELLGRHGITL